MTINKAWHEAHNLPRTAPFEQRLEWHLWHSLNCGCREMPHRIRKELEARSLLGPHASRLQAGPTVVMPRPGTATANRRTR